MHGGIGMTDEYDIGFYMKRGRVLAEISATAIFMPTGWRGSRVLSFPSCLAPAAKGPIVDGVFDSSPGEP